MAKKPPPMPLHLVDSKRSRVAIAFILPTLVMAVLAYHALAKRLRAQRTLWPVEENYVHLGSETSVRWSSLGYQELAADVTWCRMLVYYGSSILGDTDLRYLGSFIRNIIALDPQFKKLYQWAAYSVAITEKNQLSTAEEDILQSIAIAERAMVEFPDDYEFFWIAGTTYYLDLKSDDPDRQRAYQERGADYMEKAMRKPNAPKGLAAKAAAFRSKLGQQEQARENLMQMILTTDDPEAQKAMLESFRYFADEELAEELSIATRQFAELRQTHMPALPADVLVLVGGPPTSLTIDFEELATDPELFGDGSGLQPQIELFP